jgi:hypothetical protein
VSGVNCKDSLQSGWTFAAYWFSDLVNAGSWTQISSFVGLGMTWWEGKRTHSADDGKATQVIPKGGTTRNGERSMQSRAGTLAHQTWTGWTFAAYWFSDLVNAGSWTQISSFVGSEKKRTHSADDGKATQVIPKGGTTRNGERSMQSRGQAGHSPRTGSVISSTRVRGRRSRPSSGWG